MGNSHHQKGKTLQTVHLNVKYQMLSPGSQKGNKVAKSTISVYNVTLQGSSIKHEKESKAIRIGQEEIKPLFTENKTVFLENSKNL